MLNTVDLQGSNYQHDAHIRLIVDMQLYLRLLSQMRDGQQIRGALQDGVLTGRSHFWVHCFQQALRSRVSQSLSWSCLVL